MEDTARVKDEAARRKARRENTPPTTSKFVYFEEKMTKVQARTGDGKAQWVLKEHGQAWTAAASKRP